jgi:hypothetical protein
VFRWKLRKLPTTSALLVRCKQRERVVWNIACHPKSDDDNQGKPHELIWSWNPGERRSAKKQEQFRDHPVGQERHAEDEQGVVTECGAYMSVQEVVKCTGRAAAGAIVSGISTQRAGGEKPGAFRVPVIDHSRTCCAESCSRPKYCVPQSGTFNIGQAGKNCHQRCSLESPETKNGAPNSYP